MGWQESIDRTVTGLGYELVDVERAQRGLLRVTIDRVPGHAYPTGESEFITVDDCERVTRQLQYVLEVEHVAYERLEVSSPGLDRPLKKPADYARFAGHDVELTLKAAFQGRKRYAGRLEARPAAELAPTSPEPRDPAAATGPNPDAGWRLVFHDGKAEQALDFRFDEVREARLVPVINFKGRAAKPAAQPDAAPARTNE